MRVDFYILGTTDASVKWAFVAQLVEKVYRQRLSIQVSLPEVTALAQCDAALWSFRADSFVPHTVVSDTEPPQTAVALTTQMTWLPGFVVWLSVCATEPMVSVPPKVQRILEVIDASPEAREIGRMRYKAYQQAHCAITVHKSDKSAGRLKE